MKKAICVFLFFVLSFNAYSQAFYVWMLGPMLHINIGGDKVRASWGLELSYWNYDHWPYSFNGAIEFEKHKIRLYTEAQTGFGFAGVSAGPLIELRTNERTSTLGFQGSIWGNYFWGFDIRFRGTGGRFYFCPGTYVKIPVLSSGSNSGSNHYFDFDD